MRYPHGPERERWTEGKSGKSGSGEAAVEAHAPRGKRTFFDFLFAVEWPAGGALLFASLRSCSGTSMATSAMRDTTPSKAMGGFGSDAPGSSLGSLRDTY